MHFILAEKGWKSIVIAYYISSHGFGHLTRCLIHMKNDLEIKKEDLYIVCGKEQVEFAKIVLGNWDKKICFKILETDIGLINRQNSLVIDKIELEKKLFEFIGTWDMVIQNEIKFLENKNITKVVADISPIGMLVGKGLKVPVEAISNFTWYNQYSYLGLNPKIINAFYEAEKLITKFYMYPLSLNLSHIKCEKENINYVSRSLNMTKIKELKKEFGEIIFISCGKSANLETMEIKNFSGTIFYTEGINLMGEGKQIKLPVEIEDTQNYIGASDFIISKAGWGTVAEAVLAKIPMVLIERVEVLEDTHTINELKKQNKAISIKIEELKVLDIDKIKEKIK